MIVIAPPSDRRKARISVHFDRRISVANFEMDSHYSIVSYPFEKIREELPADPAALVTCANAQQQQFRFVGPATEQREADHVRASILTRQHERHSGHRQNAGEL